MKYEIDTHLFSRKLSSILIEKGMIDKKGNPDKIALYNLLYPNNKITEKDCEIDRQAVTDKTRNISNWLKGNNYPKRISDVLELCNALDCDLDYFFTDMPAPTHDIEFISQKTGLNKKSIDTLNILKRSEYIGILNYIMSDYALFGRFLSDLSLYFDNDFDTPVHYDNKLGICVESDDMPNSPFISTNGEKYVSIGKKLDYDVCGTPAYATIHVPVSILESHALRCIQAQIDDWKRNYKKESDD